MRQFKKIIGAALILALSLCSFASCDLIGGIVGGGKDPAELTAAADAFLASNPYNVEMKLKYDSDDADMLMAISTLSAEEMSLSVDGDSFVAKLALGESGADYIIYTYVDGTLYTEWSENGTTVQDKTEITDEKKAELLASVGGSADLKYTDFSEVSVASQKNVSVISCTNIKAEKISALTAALQAQLSEVFENVVVSVYNASLDIEIDDGKYTVVVLTCEYFITVDENTSYSIEMKYAMQYTYTKDREIMAPSF